MKTAFFVMICFSMSAIAQSLPQTIDGAQRQKIIAAINVVTNGISINTVYNTATSIGMKGDGTTDDSTALQTALTAAGNNGGGAFKLYSSSSNGQFFINNLVSIPSNCQIDWLSPIALGTNGHFRFNGTTDDGRMAGSTALGSLASNMVSGVTNLFLASGTGAQQQATNYAVGSFIVLRGQNDANGQSINDPDRVRIVNNDQTTRQLYFTPSTENAYNTNYPNSAWQPTGGDKSTISVLTATLLTSNGDPGTNTVVVSAGGAALFKAGNYVQFTDDATVSNNFTESTSVNPIHSELAQILSISGTTLTIDHNLHHPYSTANNGRVTHILPVEHSSINGADIICNFATQPSTDQNHILEMRYAVNCSFKDCRIRPYYDGAGVYRSYISQAYRLYNAYLCHVLNCQALNPQYTSAGDGYGCAIYQSNDNIVDGFFASGCRHSMLFFKAACYNLVKNLISDNALISDIDFHGANEIHNTVDGFLCIGGNGVDSDAGTSKTAIKIGNTSHIAGGAYNTIRNGNVFDYTIAGFTSRLAEIIPASHDNLIENVRAVGVERALYGRPLSLGAPSARQIVNNTLRNITLEGADQKVVDIDGTVNSPSTHYVDGLTLENWNLINCAKDISINQATNVTIKNLNVTLPRNTTQATITVNDVGSFVWKGGTVTAKAQGLNATTCPNLRVQDVIFDSCTSAPFVDGGGNGGYNWLDNDYPSCTSYAFSGVGTSARGEERHKRSSYYTLVNGTQSYTCTTLGASVTAIPNLTNGDLLISASYTPKNPTGRILLTGYCPSIETESAADNCMLAIFDSTVTNTLGNALIRIPTSGAASATAGTVLGSEEFTSPTARTFTFRAGPKTAGSTNIVGGRFSTNGFPQLLIYEVNR